MKKLPFKPPHTAKVNVEVCETPSCYGWEKGNIHRSNVKVAQAQKKIDAAFRLARIQARRKHAWRYVSVGWGRHSDPGVHNACTLSASVSPGGTVSSWKLDEKKFGCKPTGVTGREFAGARRKRRRR